jgi:hypothetical protein
MRPARKPAPAFLAAFQSHGTDGALEHYALRSLDLVALSPIAARLRVADKLGVEIEEVHAVTVP